MQLKVTWGRCLASAMAKDLYHLPNEISLPENIFLNLKLDEIISMDIYMCIYSKVDLISNVIQLLNHKHSHLYDLWIPELRWNLIFLNKKTKDNVLFMVDDRAYGYMIWPPKITISLNYNNIWHLSTFRPLCCFTTEKWKELIGFNDLHAQRSGDVFVSGSSSGLS